MISITAVNTTVILIVVIYTFVLDNLKFRENSDKFKINSENLFNEFSN